MGRTYTKLIAHIVFSTKNRKPLIEDAWKGDLFSYLAGILQKRKCFVHAIGGVADHIHLVLRYPAEHSIAEIVRDVKTNSSLWRHQKGDRLFQWQRGYSVFSVSESALNAVVKYVENQESHHRKMTFQDELLLFLKKHGIEPDLKYLWE